jgi:hypothetical protein
MRATPTESATSMTPSPTGRADAYPHPADLALISFATGSDPGAADFQLTPDLARHDGASYGGTGDPQMQEWRRSIAQAAAEGGTRAQEP